MLPLVAARNDTASPDSNLANARYLLSCDCRLAGPTLLTVCLFTTSLGNVTPAAVYNRGFPAPAPSLMYAALSLD